MNTVGKIKDGLKTCAELPKIYVLDWKESAERRYPDNRVGQAIYLSMAGVFHVVGTVCWYGLYKDALRALGL
jgi:hypothetical protein